MNILIISDTHGFDDRVRVILDRIGPFDMLIHCGDVEGQEAEIQEWADCPCLMVAGNNDWSSRLPREIVTTIDDYKVMITHGNRYVVSLDKEMLREEALSRDVDICMFGHTHKPLVETKGSLTMLNPGSLSYPRQISRDPTYILMRIDEEHQAHYDVRVFHD